MGMFAALNGNNSYLGKGIRESKSVEDIMEENRAKGNRTTYQPKPIKKHQQLGIRKLSKSKRSKSK